MNYLHALDKYFFISWRDVHYILMYRGPYIRNARAPVITDETRAVLSRRRAALASFGHGSAEYKQLNRAAGSAIRRDSCEDVRRCIREQGRSAMWRVIRPSVAGKGDGRMYTTWRFVRQPEPVFCRRGATRGRRGAGYGWSTSPALQAAPRWCLCAHPVAPDADWTADHRVWYERVGRERGGRHFYPHGPYVVWRDRPGAPAFGQFQHISLWCPPILETLPRSPFSQNRRSFESIQLPANIHRSRDLQNCRAGRPSTTLQLPSPKPLPLPKSARFSASSLDWNRADIHIRSYPIRQRPGRDIPPLSAGLEQMFWCDWPRKIAD